MASNKVSVPHIENDNLFLALEAELSQKSQREKRLARLKSDAPFQHEQQKAEEAEKEFSEPQENGAGQLGGDKIQFEFEELKKLVEKEPVLAFLKARVLSAEKAGNTGSLISLYRIALNTLQAEASKKTEPKQTKQQAVPETLTSEPREDKKALQTAIDEKDKELFLLRENLVKKEKQLKTSEERYDKIKFDFESFKNRNEKETVIQADKIVENAILKILPVIDNFERAFEASKTSSDYDSLAKGVTMVLSQLEDALKAVDVLTIQTENTPFDPNLHEALMAEEKDSVDEGIILEVFSKGYTFKSKLLRAAKVKVSKKNAENE